MDLKDISMKRCKKHFQIKCKLSQSGIENQYKNNSHLSKKTKISF